LVLAATARKQRHETEGSICGEQSEARVSPSRVAAPPRRRRLLTSPRVARRRPVRRRLAATPERRQIGMVREESRGIREDEGAEREEEGRGNTLGGRKWELSRQEELSGAFVGAIRTTRPRVKWPE
jgi:hypothetical protein